MVNLVLIITVILDYLIETTLKGEPGMVAFQPFLQYMVNLVLITTVILDYLIETTLKGEPGMVDFVFWIVYESCSDCLYQFHFDFGAVLLKCWFALKNPKSSTFMPGELAA